MVYRLENSGRSPCLESAMSSGHGDTERWGQVAPRATAGQHEHDRGEHGTFIARSSAASLPTGSKPWDQRINNVPQGIWHQTQSQVFSHTSHYATQTTTTTRDTLLVP